MVSVLRSVHELSVNTIAVYPRSLCGLDSVFVFQPAPGVAVLHVCVQEAEAARTLQARGTIAELQRQLVSGARRAQHAVSVPCGLRVLGGFSSAVRVMCDVRS
jgi:hypothetical protein